MSNTTTAYAYQFDSNGYYLNETLVQKMGDDYLVPPDSTMSEPTFKAGYWAKWNGSKWVNEKIPTTCADAIKKGLSCISNGQGKHNYEVKTLLESLVAADSENYRTVVSDKFVMAIEEIPEPTEEEKQQKEAEAKERAFEAAVEELIKEMSKADLIGDEAWKAELRAEYEALISENEE